MCDDITIENSFGEEIHSDPEGPAVPHILYEGDYISCKSTEVGITYWWTKDLDEDGQQADGPISLSFQNEEDSSNRFVCNVLNTYIIIKRKTASVNNLTQSSTFRHE